MLNRTLSILLTAMLAACPYFCKGGGASHAGEHAQARSHVHSPCGCCHGELPLLSHDDQSPTSDSRGDSPPCSDQCGGQCICNGAVVEDAVAIDLDLNPGWWVVAVVPQSLVIEASDFRGSPPWHAPPPDDGANLGRTLCCLYQTFLC